ncbi:ribonuclease P [Candidatus Woesearchaeota archaeon]|nr:ribonuclease P [Candidatus Woesearchaeota archaeon]
MNKQQIEYRRIAKERIAVLFKEADEVFEKNQKLANRYVELARKIAMKTNIKMPRKFKRRFCKHCHSLFRHGVNCRVRTGKNSVIYHCYNCKKSLRIPFVREKKANASC